jgi:hypothetical protein
MTKKELANLMDQLTVRQHACTEQLSVMGKHGQLLRNNQDAVIPWNRWMMRVDVYACVIRGEGCDLW